MYYYILEVRHELVSFSSHELSVWLSRISFFDLVPGVLLFSNMAPNCKTDSYKETSCIIPWKEIYPVVKRYPARERNIHRKYSARATCC